MWLLRSCLVAFASSALLTGVAIAQPRVQSTVSPMPEVSAALAGSVTINIGSGATQSLGSVTDNAPNNFPSSVSITLTWDLLPQTGTVEVVGYFANPSAAMASGPVSVPSSWMKGRVTAATQNVPVNNMPATYTAFTQTGIGGVGTAGGSLRLFSVPVLGYSKTGSVTANLDLQLDLTGQVLSVGTYSGTLTIRAVSQ